MDTLLIIWIAILIATLVTEAVSAGMTSIWFSCGAAVAIVVSLLNGPIWLQVIVFFAVSMICLLLFRPLANRYIMPKKTATNYEEAIGKKVKVVERVDNIGETGKVLYNGIEWTARMINDEVFLDKDECGYVMRVEGVKLILSPTANGNETV